MASYQVHVPSSIRTLAAVTLLLASCSPRTPADAIRVVRIEPFLAQLGTKHDEEARTESAATLESFGLVKEHLTSIRFKSKAAVSERTYVRPLVQVHSFLSDALAEEAWSHFLKRIKRDESNPDVKSGWGSLVLSGSQIFELKVGCILGEPRWRSMEADFRSVAMDSLQGSKFVTCRCGFSCWEDSPGRH